MFELELKTNGFICVCYFLHECRLQYKYYLDLILVFFIVICDSVYVAYIYPFSFFLPCLVLHNRISGLSPPRRKKFINNLLSSICNWHNIVFGSPIEWHRYLCWCSSGMWCCVDSWVSVVLQSRRTALTLSLPWKAQS